MRTAYICNGDVGVSGNNGINGLNGAAGVNGANALVNSRAEPAGANCPHWRVRNKHGI